MRSLTLFSLLALGCEAGGFDLIDRQDAPVVSGRVLSEQGAPIEGARVYLARDGQAQRSTMTSAGGYYAFEEVEPGPLTLVVNLGENRGAVGHARIRPGGMNTVTELVIAPLHLQLEILSIRGVNYEERISAFEHQIQIRQGQSEFPRLIAESDLEGSAGGEALLSTLRFYNLEPTRTPQIAPLAHLSVEGYFNPGRQTHGEGWMEIVREWGPDGWGCHFYDAAQGRALMTLRSEGDCTPWHVGVSRQGLVLVRKEGYPARWLIERYDRAGALLGQEPLPVAEGAALDPIYWPYTRPKRSHLFYVDRLECEETARCNYRLRAQRTDRPETLEPVIELGRFEEPWLAWASLDQERFFVQEVLEDDEQSRSTLWSFEISSGRRTELLRRECPGRGSCFSAYKVSRDADEVLLAMHGEPGLWTVDLRTGALQPVSLPPELVSIIQNKCKRWRGYPGECYLLDWPQGLGVGFGFGFGIGIGIVNEDWSERWIHFDGAQIRSFPEPTSSDNSRDDWSPFELNHSPSGEREVLQVFDQGGMLHYLAGPAGAPASDFEQLTFIPRRRELLGVTAKGLYYTMKDPVLGNTQIFFKSL